MTQPIFLLSLIRDQLILDPVHPTTERIVIDHSEIYCAKLTTDFILEVSSARGTNYYYGVHPSGKTSTDIKELVAYKSVNTYLLFVSYRQIDRVMYVDPANTMSWQRFELELQRRRMPNIWSTFPSPRTFLFFKTSMLALFGNGSKGKNDIADHAYLFFHEAFRIAEFDARYKDNVFGQMPIDFTSHPIDAADCAHADPTDSESQ